MMIIINSLMKQIIEENRIVESISILLYSRKYEKLFCEINDIQTHQSILKSQLSACKNVGTHLGRALSKVKIGLKLNENSTSILNYCKIGHKDSDEESIIQKRSNYLKVKAKFKQYSLLFQIYYSNGQMEAEIKHKQQQVLLKQEVSQIKYNQQMLQQYINVTKIHLNNLQNKVLNRAFFNKKVVQISSETQSQEQVNINTNININKKIKINKNIKSLTSRIGYRTKEIKTNTKKLNQLITNNTTRPNKLKQLAQSSTTNWKKKPLYKQWQIQRNQRQILFLDQQVKLEIAKNSMKNIILQVNQYNSQKKIGLNSKNKTLEPKSLIKIKNQKNLQDIINQFRLNELGNPKSARNTKILRNQQLNLKTQSCQNKKIISNKTSLVKNKQNIYQNKLNKLFIIKKPKIKVNQKQNQEFLQKFYQDSINKIKKQVNLIKYVKDYCSNKLSND